MEKVYEVEVLENKNLSKPIGNVKQAESIKYMLKNDINELLSYEKNNRNRIFCKFLFITGLRISEAISIRKQDIDFENNLITVIWLKKRKKMTRTIPLHKDIKELLLLYTANLNLKDRLFPFTRQNGSYITLDVLGVTPHILRHSFAVNYMLSGGRIEDCQVLMGHSNINVTMIYSSITKKHLGQELNKIEF